MLIKELRNSHRVQVCHQNRSPTAASELCKAATATISLHSLHINHVLKHTGPEVGYLTFLNWKPLAVCFCVSLFGSCCGIEKEAHSQHRGAWSQTWGWPQLHLLILDAGRLRGLFWWNGEDPSQITQITLRTVPFHAKCSLLTLLKTCYPKHAHLWSITYLLIRDFLQMKRWVCHCCQWYSSFQVKIKSFGKLVSVKRVLKRSTERIKSDFLDTVWNISIQKLCVIHRDISQIANG
jgi:hypothetical protein